jgi:hypothetical protein
MVTQFANQPEGVISFSYSPEAHGIGKFVVLDDAEERSVYIDMSTSPPTIYGPEHRKSRAVDTLLEATS